MTVSYSYEATREWISMSERSVVVKWERDEPEDNCEVLSGYYAHARPQKQSAQEKWPLWLEPELVILRAWHK